MRICAGGPNGEGRGHLIPATQITRCPEHQRAVWRARNAARAGTFEAVAYNSAAYRAARAEVMAGAWKCSWCGATGVRLVAGHIQSIRKRPDLAVDASNLAPSCVSCNEKEKRR